MGIREYEKIIKNYIKSEYDIDSIQVIESKEMQRLVIIIDFRYLIGIIKFVVEYSDIFFYSNNTQICNDIDKLINEGVEFYLKK